MVVIQTDTNSKILEVDNSIFADVKEFLKNITIKKQTRFSYIDDFGDKIEVINGKEYVIPTAQDIQDVAIKDDFIDEEKVKEILDV